MEEQLDAVLEDARSREPQITNRPNFEQFKASIAGPKGSLTALMKEMKSVPKEDKPKIGKKINEIKTALEELFSSSLQKIEDAEIQKSLGEPIDPTLPAAELQLGSLHPLTQVREKMVSIFRKAGFTIAEESEAETEWFCFDALNTPADHPARDEQDTLFFPTDAAFQNVSKKEDERYLLRTHTSSVQIRTLLKEKPPVRIIAPGRVFRRDTVDATHSANFHQFEGLYIDKDVSLKDLKSILDHLIKNIFGKKVQTRLRPSFFPFTEPSFELDINSPDLGKLSNQWIEIMGCGMVDPNVLKSVNLDPEEWSGYAFGIGIERVAMIQYGIDDIRYFYQNDLRFLRQFS